MTVNDQNNENISNIVLNGDSITVQQSTTISVDDELKLYTEDSVITLNVKVSADFSTIPANYHEVFMNMMSAKYIGKVSFGDNPFSTCVPKPKKSWFKFW